MQDDEIRLPERDRLRVRVFTLADYGATPPDGKLYIGGAGVHQLNLANLPGPIGVPVYLVVRLYVPYLELIDAHHVRIRILDEDEQPIGQDPLLDLPNIETGRAPGTRAGDEGAINIVIGLVGYPITRNFDRELRARIHLEVNEHELDTLPLKITRIPQPQQLPGGPG